MRLAIIKSNYTPYGGAEKYTTRLINSFLKRNIEVDVLTSMGGNWNMVDQKFKRVVLNQFRFNNLLKLLTFNSSVKKYLKEERYDCIFGMDRTDYQTHLRAGSGCHAAWIQRRCDVSSPLRCMSFKANPFHNAMIAMEKRAFLSDKLIRIFCNSLLVKKELMHFYPQTDKKLEVVHNGVEWDEFSEAFQEGPTKKGNILKSLNLAGGKFYFLFLGSGYERKGLLRAVNALPLLPEYTEIIVVGKDKNEDWYKAVCEKSGEKERVHFFGPQKNVIPFFQVSDAFVLPTLYDPFANASLEALAMGLYTVTSGANGCSEVIQKGAGSVIGDLKNTDSVAEAMKTALGEHLSQEEIRETVKYLDFEIQLKKIVDTCIADSDK